MSKEVRIKLLEFLANLWLKLCQEIKESLGERKKSRLLDKLLWVVIILITSYVIRAMFGSGWAVVTFFGIVISRIFYNMEPKGFLTVCAILIAAYQLYSQNAALSTQNKTLEAQMEQNRALELSLQQQTKQFILDKRPYLFTKFSRDLFLRERPSLSDILCGVEMVFHNSGRLPATIIDTQCVVSDDTGRFEDYRQWHIGTHGGFPELKVIPPQDINRPPKDYIPAISTNANLVCISVIISYQGPESDSIYWSMTSQFWKIGRNEEGKLSTFFLDKKEDWDECEDRPVPQLEPPDWLKYKK